MITENLKRIRKIKKLFYFVAGIGVVASLFFFFTARDIYGFIAAGVVVVWFLAFQFTDFQYIHFEIKEGKLILRFYPVVKFGRKDYSSVEFPASTLMDYKLEKSVFGLVYDLILVVRTKRGIAEYPPVSLAAITRVEQREMEQQLKALLKR